MNTTNKHPQYHFNPLELSFCGLSGSGKTTLIEKLAHKWRQQGFDFAYIKHDAHSFEMDQQGKDTARIAQAGAVGTFINNDHKQAFLGYAPQTQSAINFHSFDFAIVEGYKTFLMPKIVVLDPNLEIKKHLAKDANILAYVGEFHSIGTTFEGKPYFHRDHTDTISRFVIDYFSLHTQARPLYGLVLAGGKSRRMGHDKALLKYHGKNQLAHAVELLSPHCQKVFYSARQEQLRDYSSLCGGDAIADTFLNLGPLGGILSAMRSHPDARWLVTAIDLPALDTKTIKHLIDSKNSFKFATAYLSQDEQYIEPLCAIYEPKCYGALLNALSANTLCPTKILKTINTQLVKQLPQTNSLYNANTPLDYKKFKKHSEESHEQCATY